MIIKKYELNDLICDIEPNITEEIVTDDITMNDELENVDITRPAPSKEFMPLDISILPQGDITLSQSTLNSTLISIYQNNEAKQVELKELKNLNTKIISTDNMNDNNIKELSVGDYIYLETEEI